MKTLVSRDSYDDLEQKFWTRARKVVGVLFGLAMCLATVVQQATVLGFGLSLSFGIVIGVVTGAFFGWLWAWVMRRSARKYSHRVYKGDTDVVGKVPDNREYPYRIPCSLFATNNVTVGGVLYIGSRGARFVPHQRYRGEKTIKLDRDGIVAWAVDWKPNWWGRTFVASGPRVLEMGGKDQRFRFAFPDVDVVLPRIREALGQQG